MLGGFGSCAYRINDEREEGGGTWAVLFGARQTGDDGRAKMRRFATRDTNTSCLGWPLRLAHDWFPYNSGTYECFAGSDCAGDSQESG